MAARSSCWRQVLRDLLDNKDKFSMQAFCSMSGYATSFPMEVLMVSRHTWTVYMTMVVCSLFPVIVSSSGLEVMMSPSLMAALKWKGVR